MAARSSLITFIFQTISVTPNYFLSKFYSIDALSIEMFLKNYVMGEVFFFKKGFYFTSSEKFPIAAFFKTFLSMKHVLCKLLMKKKSRVTELVRDIITIKLYLVAILKRLCCYSNWCQAQVLNSFPLQVCFPKRVLSFSPLAEHLTLNTPV